MTHVKYRFEPAAPPPPQKKPNNCIWHFPPVGLSETWRSRLELPVAAGSPDLQPPSLPRTQTQWLLCELAALTPPSWDCCFHVLSKACRFIAPWRRSAWQKLLTAVCSFTVLSSVCWPTSHHTTCFWRIPHKLQTTAPIKTLMTAPAVPLSVRSTWSYITDICISFYRMMSS